MADWKIASIICFALLVSLAVALAVALLVCKLSLANQYPTSCKVSYIVVSVCIGIMTLLTIVFTVLYAKQGTNHHNLAGDLMLMDVPALIADSAKTISPQPATALKELKIIRDKLWINLNQNAYWDENDATQKVYIDNVINDLRMATLTADKTRTLTEEFIRKRNLIKDALHYITKPINERTDKPTL